MTVFHCALYSVFCMLYVYVVSWEKGTPVHSFIHPFITLEKLTHFLKTSSHTHYTIHNAYIIHQTPNTKHQAQNNCRIQDSKTCVQGKWSTPFSPIWTLAFLFSSLFWRVIMYPCFYVCTFALSSSKSTLHVYTVQSTFAHLRLTLIV